MYFCADLDPIYNSSSRLIGPFSLFQNLELGKSSTYDKYHFPISWDRACQYQCVCKKLSNYSKRLKSHRHLSLFVQSVRVQNLHKLSGDKIKCLIIGQTLKVSLQLRLTFLGLCNCRLIGIMDQTHTQVKKHHLRTVNIFSYFPPSFCKMINIKINR